MALVPTLEFNHTPTVPGPGSRFNDLPPGAYLVRIDKDGKFDARLLPKGALLLDGDAWTRFWDALKDCVPLQADWGP